MCLAHDGHQPPGQAMIAYLTHPTHVRRAFWLCALAVLVLSLMPVVRAAGLCLAAGALGAARGAAVVGGGWCH